MSNSMSGSCIPKEFMVRVHCMTYNHAPYIEDAMNGFCMQETDFPFVCVIVDDASTDGEPEVIRDYLQKNFALDDSAYTRFEETDDYVLTIARHKTNHHCFFGVLFLKYNHYHKKEKKPYFDDWSQAKYTALCEGDDYWTHPQKLQIQVEFLENHNDISYCCSRYKVLNYYNNCRFVGPNYYFDMESHQKEQLFRFNRDEAFTKPWVTKTLTCVYRTNALDDSFVRQFKYGRDVHMVYNILSHGNGVCFSFVCGVYRKHTGGIYGSLSLLDQTKIDYKVYSEMSSKLNDPIIDRDAIRYFSRLIKYGEKPIPKKISEIVCYFQYWNLLDKLRVRIALRTRIKSFFSRFKSLK